MWYYDTTRADNDTDTISSADLREVARELSQSRGQEVVTVPEPSGGDGDEGDDSLTLNADTETAANQEAEAA